VKRPYQITGALLAVFGAFMTRESFLLKLYTSQGPGPGLLPLFTSIVIMLLGGIMFFQATFRTSDPLPAEFFPPMAGTIRIVALMAASIAFALLMVPLGFIASCTIFLLFVLFVVGREKPLIGIGVALVGSVGVYLVFARWLQIPLPKGVFGI
jgi:putative tricarboxylic transport membrane protein